MATALADSRVGALRACVQEHVDITLNEVGDKVRGGGLVGRGARGCPRKREIERMRANFD